MEKVTSDDYISLEDLNKKVYPEKTFSVKTTILISRTIDFFWYVKKIWDKKLIVVWAVTLGILVGFFRTGLVKGLLFSTVLSLGYAYFLFKSSSGDTTRQKKKN